MLPAINGRLKQQEGWFSLAQEVLTVSFGGFAPWCAAAFAKRLGATVQESQTGQIMLLRDDSLPPEAYVLTVTAEGIRVQVACEQSVILALTTLYQLMDGQRRVPCLSLTDAPRYQHRGLSLDCVRCFFPVGEVRRVIEQMARVKLNVLHWVLTNDQGWRIESRQYPRLNEISGPYYTRDEIRNVVAYARERGIEIIPEIDMPGHMTALLAAYPEYSCSGKPVQLAKTGGIYPIILCAGAEKTYELIDSLLGEVCSLFPGGRIHLGGDEAPKREWKTCPCCQQRKRDEGLADENELQGWFMNRAIAIGLTHGKQAICWNESLMGGNLDSSAAIQYWTVDQAEPTKVFLQKDGRLIYSDMFSLYLDYPTVCTPLSRVYGDAQVLDDLDVSDKVYGVEACLWAEHVRDAESLEQLLFPRLYAFAEMAWSKSQDYADFRSRLPAFLQVHHPADMTLTPEDAWEADMPDRIPWVLAHMQSITAVMSEEARASTMAAAEPTPAFRRRFASCFLGVTKGEES